MAKKVPPNTYEIFTDYVKVTIYGYEGETKASFIVDLEDLEFVKSFKWYRGTNGYIYTKINRKVHYLHNLILGIFFSDGKVTDHINGDNQNNRRYNLRRVTKTQNQYNSKTPKNNKSGIAGVNFHKASGKWRAYITDSQGKQKSLGLFKEIDGAIQARRTAEIQLYGSYRRQVI